MNRYALDVVNVISPACSCRCGRSIKYEHNDSRPCILCGIFLLLVIYAASLVRWLSGWQMCVSDSRLIRFCHHHGSSCGIIAPCLHTFAVLMVGSYLSRRCTKQSQAVPLLPSIVCLDSAWSVVIQQRKKRTTSTGPGVWIVAYLLTECRRSLITSLPR